jgi:hypothetical protein
MAKYRDGKADIKGRENWIIRFPWDRLVLLRQEARPTTNPGHRHGEIQKFGVVVNRSIICHLTF